MTNNNYILGQENNKKSDIITDQNQVIGLSAKLNKEHQTNPQTNTSSNYITVDNGIGILSGDLAVDALDWIKKTYAPYSVRINNISTTMDDNNVPVISQTNPDLMIMVNMYLKKNHPELKIAAQMDMFEAKQRGILSNLDSRYNFETGVILNYHHNHRIDPLVVGLKKEVERLGCDTSTPVFVNYASIEIETLDVKIQNRTQKHFTYKIPDDFIFNLISSSDMNKLSRANKLYKGDHGMRLLYPSDPFVYYPNEFQRLLNIVQADKYEAQTCTHSRFIDSRIWIVKPDKFYENVIVT